MSDFWGNTFYRIWPVICVILALVVVILVVIAVIVTFIPADLTSDFDYAIISYGDGVSLKIEIASCQYDREHTYKIVSTTGTVYLVHSANLILVKEGE